MKSNKIKYLLTASALLTPAFAFAALSGLSGLLTDFKGILNQVIQVLFGISLIFFFWGIAQFILNAGDEKTREAGKQKMLWGVIALFVFISIFGILKYIGDTIGIKPSASGPDTSFDEGVF